MSGPSGWARSDQRHARRGPPALRLGARLVTATAAGEIFSTIVLRSRECDHPASDGLAGDLPHAPFYGPAEGRPVLNLTRAQLFHRRLVVFGYHLFNWRALGGGAHAVRLAPPVGPKDVPIAAAIALVWAVHPLQTEAVTYTVQRAES